MLGRAAGRLIRAGRGAFSSVGLAVVMALAIGVVGTALGANGGNFKLGQNNVATAVTGLAGTAGVDGPMLRVKNNDSGADDTALSLRVQDGEAPLSVNSDESVNRLNADQVDGFHAGCEAGRRLIAGLCWDETPQAAATVTNAADDCHDLDGQLPAALDLRAIRSETGIDLGTGTTGHWSSDMQFVGTATPPNDLHAVAVFDSGGVSLRDDQESRPFRCVYQPLTSE